jgi:hypothetical protein
MDSLDWIEHDTDVVIRHQHETAVFVTAEGSVAIWQRGWPDDDQSIVITGPNLPALIARLQAAMGEVAEFAAWERENPDEAMADRRERMRSLRAEIDRGDDDDATELAKAIALPLPSKTSNGLDIAPRSPPALFDDPWRSPVADHLKGRRRVTVTEVIEGALHVDPTSTATQRRVADIMLGLGWQRGQRTKDDRWWINGESVTGNSVTTAANDAPVNAACRVVSPVKRSS